MTQDKPFELRIFPQDETDYGLELHQRATRKDGGKGQYHPVVRLWGTPFRSVLDVILEIIKRNGYRATDLRRGRKDPLSLDEIGGVRLGLLFLAVKPLKKPARIEAISRGVRDMEPEEAYYWYSKLTKVEFTRRAGKALRVLLAKE
jgi:hypothetical protein